MSKKISELTSASALTGAEVPVLNQGGTTKKVDALNEVSARTKAYIESTGLLTISNIVASLVTSNLVGSVSGGTVGGILEANLLDKSATETISGAYTFSALLTGLTGNFSGNVEAAGFTINGVPVATSSDSFWSAVGDGGISYGDYIDPLSIADPIIKAVDKIALSSGSINGIFLYDTAKDSDGGAWRDKTSEKTWYTETLDTGTRGATRKFPSRAMIVAIAGGGVNIYDMDDSALPLWMKFTQAGTITTGNTITSEFDSAGSIARVYMIQGILYVTHNNNGLKIIDFCSEESFCIGSLEYKYLGNIEQRNEGLGWVQYSTKALVAGNWQPREITGKIALNAPIDACSGLCVPTILVATTAGYSVLNNDGTIADITGQTDNSNTRITLNQILGSKGDSTGQLDVFDTVPSGDVVHSDARSRIYSEFGTPALGLYATGLTIAAILQLNNNEIILGSGYGIVKLLEDRESQASGMVNYISAEFQTGWLFGLNQLAVLSSNDDTNLVYANLASDFGDGSTYTEGTGWTDNGDGTATCDGSQLGDSDFSSGVVEYTLEAGKAYVVQIIVTGYGAGNLTPDLFFGAKPAISANGIYEYYFRAIETPYSESFIFTADLNFVGTIEVTFSQGDNDRGRRLTNLMVTGSIIKASVATSAELMGYSGYSAVNYLSQQNNSNLDPSTDNFYYMCWVKSSTISSSSHITCRAYYSGAWSGSIIALAMDATGKIFLLISDDALVSNDTITSTNTYDDDVWHLVVAFRDSTEIKLYVDGVEAASPVTIVNAAGSLDNSDAILSIGRSPDGGSEFSTGTIALHRIGLYAPSEAQILKSYLDEKEMFEPNTNCALTPSIQDVVSISNDPDTDLTYIGTDIGTNVFKGSVRTDYIDDSGVSTDNEVRAISASNNSYALATLSEAIGNIPQANIRDELIALQTPVEEEALMKEYDPVVSVATDTEPTFTTEKGYYRVDGNKVDVNIALINSSGGTAGSGTTQLFTVTLPFNILIHANLVTTEMMVGTGLTQNGAVSNGNNLIARAVDNDKVTLYKEGNEPLEAVDLNDANDRRIYLNLSYIRA